MLTLTTAILWEIGENTDYIINLFRENSGPSEKYKGDSKINSFGDVLACSLGYSMSYILSRYVGGSFLPALAYIILAETLMAAKYRDNILLLGYQVLADDPVINAWQVQIIPVRFRQAGRAGYWAQRMASHKKSTLYNDNIHSITIENLPK